ncbi:hypothetical protein [Streptomyces sp. NPDC058701]|uniref:hypothetical protein n=1 Tax=Streptomyces sp. NPDC058701 TaxID=3346608 RepID=UPI00364A20FB
MNAVLKTARRMRLASLLAVPVALSLATVAAPAVASPNAVAVQAADCSSLRTLGTKGKAAKAKPARSARQLAAAGCTGPRGSQGPRGPKGDRGPAGPAGPCIDLAVVAGVATGSEYSAALTRGKAFVGYRPSSTGAYIWRDLTGSTTPGYPRNACGVAVKLDSGRVYVKVLTTAGDVYETSCSAPALACTLGWAAVVRP